MIDKKVFWSLFVANIFLCLQTEARCTAEADIKPNCCVGPSLCTSQPMIDSCYENGQWSLEIGFLLEQARMTGTQIAFTLSDPTFSTPAPFYSSVISPSFDLDWGVTAGIGWFFKEDGWFLGARFDWLESTASKSRDSGNFIPAFYSLNTNGIVANALQGQLKVNYYMLDVLLCRGTYLSGCFAIDPHMGVKAAWFYNRAHFDFISTSDETYRRKIRSKSWGVGPELGLDLSFSLADGISLYGESGFSLLFGNSQAKDVDQLLTTDSTITAKESYDVASPSVRLAIGLSLSSCFCENQHYVYLNLAFDSVFYWNQYDHIDDFAGGDFLGPTSLRVQFLSSDNNTFSLMGFKLVVGWVF